MDEIIVNGFRYRKISGTWRKFIPETELHDGWWYLNVEEIQGPLLDRIAALELENSNLKARIDRPIINKTSKAVKELTDATT